ncbi:MAG: 1,4-dihydroxy-2-naphthoate octaprenyltransferase [Cyclobacteriaceae bacterium]
MKNWIIAFRLRTLPLALSSVGMGGFLAAHQERFQLNIFLLTALTTIFLQVLSNLANDYGDSVHGADHAGRKGPLRTVQSGSISLSTMRTAVIIFAFLSLTSGLILLFAAFGSDLLNALGWLVIGCICIYAAITYTAGKKPYGYLGFGDLSVFIFFGVIGVMGSQYMQTRTFDILHLIPAAATGLWAVAVLNLNNIRDIESDRIAGKYSVPVRFGHTAALTYHRFLLFGPFALGIIFQLADLVRSNLDFQPLRFVFLITLPVAFMLEHAIRRKKPDQLDPLLKKTALTSLAFMILFGIGLIVNNPS